MSDAIYIGRPVSRVRALLRQAEDRSFFALGEGLVHAHAPLGVVCSAPYVELGKEFWAALEFELYELLCDRKRKIPKEWATELIAGDVRDLSVAIITLLMAQFEVTLAIAVPATALIVRKRLMGLCVTSQKRPKRSVRQIMAGWKRSWTKHDH